MGLPKLRVLDAFAGVGYFAGGLLFVGAGFVLGGRLDGLDLAHIQLPELKKRVLVFGFGPVLLLSLLLDSLLQLLQDVVALELRVGRHLNSKYIIKKSTMQAQILDNANCPPIDYI